MGEALLLSWNLGEGIASAVRWHHNPLETAPQHQRLVALVALGNQAAMDLQVGFGKPDALEGATREALEILRIDEATYEEHRAAAMDTLERDKALITRF